MPTIPLYIQKKLFCKKKDDIISLMKTIILASGSDRRKDILKKFGIKFKVIKSNYREDLKAASDPHKLAQKMSLGKAKKVYKNNKEDIIIAADTLVVCENQILAKPKSKKHAKEMLSLLSGKMHRVITGFTIINGESGEIINKSEETKVFMRKITSGEMDWYISTKEPFGKAGGYALQGKAGIFIKKVEGDFFNAVGLPIYSIIKILKLFLV